MIYVAVVFSILTTQAESIIWGPSNIGKGYCDQDQANITVKTDCDVSEIVVSITDRQYDFSTTVLQCNEVNNSIRCYVFFEGSAKYNIAKQTLEIFFHFDHRHHLGKYANVNAICQNQTRIKDYVLLQPCLSDFTANVTRDGDKLTVYCQHYSFNYSDTGIRITNETGGNDLLQCTNISCQGGKRLPNGGYLEVAYHPGMILLCKMDGAVLDLTHLIDRSTLEPPNTTSITVSTPSASHSVTLTTQNHSGRLGVFKVLLMCFVVVSLTSFITP